MKSFLDRNPVTIGVVSVATIAALLVTAYRSDDLPVIGGGTTYLADFTTSSGIKPGDEVRVSGIKVGKVTDVGLENDHVSVHFKAKGAWIGDQSRVSIEIKNLLGQKYLSVLPAGSQALDPDDVIPVQRTSSPLDVTSALSETTRTVQGLDTGRLAQSLKTLDDAFKGAPAYLRQSLDGLSQLSQTVSSRDAELGKLLQNTAQISKVVADRNDDVRKLLNDGNLLLQELQNREQAIGHLLSSAQAFATQISGLVKDNQAQIQPALDNLGKVTRLLADNKEKLGASIAGLAPYIRLFTNLVGNGHWFDAYVCGLLPPTVDLGFLAVNGSGCLGDSSAVTTPQGSK
ncbi:MCE family protein [Amycolatopsis sp. NPDC049691]|uniref:MCE family protein n=1 Tax=Amycolatopsis sp. NPDC049691 TaxID=3155155 RepID=UPI0034215B71